MTTAELPLPDFDHLPLGSVQHRIRSLDADEVRALVQHEQAHGHRVPVLQLLNSRLDQLAAGAQPSGGDQSAPAPELAPAPAGGSQVTPATAGPKLNPPSQGDPTNPSQPR